MLNIVKYKQKANKKSSLIKAKANKYLSTGKVNKQIIKISL